MQYPAVFCCLCSPPQVIKFRQMRGESPTIAKGIGKGPFQCVQWTPVNNASVICA